MSARIYSAQEEATLRLPPLPEVPFIGQAESLRLNAAWERYRADYRERHPHAPASSGART
jgi:hypothetical protein